jgi:hypothetical protein
MFFCGWEQRELLLISQITSKLFFSSCLPPQKWKTNLIVFEKHLDDQLSLSITHLLQPFFTFFFFAHDSYGCLLPTTKVLLKMNHSISCECTLSYVSAFGAKWMRVIFVLSRAFKVWLDSHLQCTTLPQCYCC